MTQFTDAERERIRAEMIDAGHELFAQFGFDRTRVSDITDEVDIGTSTFYQFFESKEELYFIVLVEERNQLFDELEQAVTQAETPQAEAEIILRTTLKQVRSNPLINRLFVKGEIRRIDERMSRTRFEKSANEEQDSQIEQRNVTDTVNSQFEQEFTQVLPQPEQWVTHDDVQVSNPDVIRGIMRSLLFVTQAKETPVIPEEMYGEIEEALIDVIVAGLFSDEN
ncbi:transcriptional regulator [Halorubrum sp. E3]|nr:transcriptional regulator [Halorubrum sp. E3]OYR84418.1 transcriptional regulator [Halorubrum distributum]